MRKLLSFLVLSVWIVIEPLRAADVMLDGRSIHLEFSPDVTMPFDTNRIAAELSSFFAPDIGLERFFRFDEGMTNEPISLRPPCPLLPPQSVASDILYFPSGAGRLVLGETAVATIQGAIVQSAPYSNTWAQAESLLSSLSSGTITNDMQQARTSFVINGAILSESDRDEELRSGIESYWSHLQYFPLSLLDWRMGKLTNEGSILPAIHFKFIDTEMETNRIDSGLLVLIDGRWRISLSE